MPTAVLISVTCASAADDFAELVRSLLAQDADVVHVVVRRGQETPEAQPLTEDTAHGSYVRYEIESPLKISLSEARNRAINCEPFQQALLTADIVAFPDDDCTYPTGLLQSVGTLLEGTDFVTVPYAPNLNSVDTARFPRRRHQVSLADVMRRTSSNTFFVKPHVARSVGRFDESLGLGTPLNSSEDAEYLARALANGFHGVYVGDADVATLHPYKQQRPGQYYVGNVALLARYARTGILPAGLFARRLLGGLALVMSRRLSPREYLHTLRVAIHQFRQGTR